MTSVRSASGEAITFNAASACASFSAGEIITDVSPERWIRASPSDHSTSTTTRCAPGAAKQRALGAPQQRDPVAGRLTGGELEAISSSSIHRTSGQNVLTVPEGSTTRPRTAPPFIVRFAGISNACSVMFVIANSTRTGAPIGIAAISGFTVSVSPRRPRPSRSG